MCQDTSRREIMRKNSVRELTISALLIAMGIIIPMVMPRITIGPASFTLASHVPVFLAMFISPQAAIAVSLGTGFGFFLSATPVIALRALSHLIFAAIGSLYLKKHPEVALRSQTFSLFNSRFQLFNLVIAVIHSAAELVVITVFYTMGNLPETYYSQGYIYSILLLMGVGGIIHSMVDFTLAYFIAGSLSKTTDIPVFTHARKLLQRSQSLNS